MALSVNAGEYKSRVGLDSLYIAQVTVDTTATFTAGTPEYLAPAAEASQQPTVNAETQYADDQPYEALTSEGETVVNLTITGLPAAMFALLLGRVYDSASGRVFDNSGAVPPYFALSFRSLKSNGSYRYFQYLKGRFSTPNEDSATKGDTPDPKTTELVYTAVRTVHPFDLGDITESVKRVFGDSDSTNFVGTTWFSQVQTPDAVAPSSLALSSSDPTDGASAQAVSKTITLTFNNALPAGEIYHVVVAKADGTVVVCTNSLDTAKKVMTVNPDANLDAASTYIVAIGVTDIYGDTLQTAINFATA